MLKFQHNVLDDLRRRFRYKWERVDRWTILDAATGPLEGDCEDFALTVAWVLSGRSWFRLLWHVTLLRIVMCNVVTAGGVGHMALWVRGHGWICNIYPQFGARRHRLRLPFILPLFLLGALMKRLGRAR